MISFREYFRRDGLLILAALLLAVLVWNYVNDELTETRTVFPRLQLEASEGLTVAAGAPTEVRVVLRGTKRSLNAVDTARMVIHYKLPGRPGPAEVALRQSDFSLPAGVEVSEYPERFEIELVSIEKRKVPVRVAVSESLPQAGFVVNGVPMAEPGQVEVSGRREAVEAVSQILTQPLDLRGKNQPFSTDVELIAPPGTQVWPRWVRVFVDIGAEPAVRDVSGVEVKVLVPGSFNMKVRVEPPSITVRLRGAPAVLTGLAARDILAVAEAPELSRPLRAGTVDAAVRLILPPGVTQALDAAVPRVKIHISEN